MFDNNPAKTLSLLEKLRAKRLAMAQEIERNTLPERTEVAKVIPSVILPEENLTTTDRYGKVISLNKKQSEFVRLISEGKSAVLIGAAGTGKTTCQGAGIHALIQVGIAGTLVAGAHKNLISGTPGIVVCAYTRRAVTNIKRGLSKDLQNNCLTIHKLLGFRPNFEEVYDEKTGDYRTSMRFEPAYNAANPLPSSIKVIIVEESSMLGTDLHNQLEAACPHKPQIIYLGDIQQLPPTFGSAILGFKLLELPVIELTEVYRQALESPILSLAWKVLRGETFDSEEFAKLSVAGKLKIHPWKKKIATDVATGTLKQFLIKAAENGQYIPGEDMILMPFNKGCGTIEINLAIGNYLAKKAQRTVYHVLSGFDSHYLSIGESVMYDKEDATVIDIYPNPDYSGRQPHMASVTLDYWGNDSVVHNELDLETTSDAEIEAILARAASSEDRVKQSSHSVVIKLSASDETVELSTAGEVNKLLLGYALTVHKAQGSEWRKVFFLTHHSHSRMLQRELIYTAITRAREELYIICEPDMFQKGILSQRIKGDTLAEKAEFFKGKVRANNQLMEEEMA
jgi:exodeoxyribonuclease V alpha subunit